MRAGVRDRHRFRWGRWGTDFEDGTASEIAESLPASIQSFAVVGPPWSDADAATF
jgi:hypothetical protein